MRMDGLLSFSLKSESKSKMLNILFCPNSKKNPSLGAVVSGYSLREEFAAFEVF